MKQITDFIDDNGLIVHRPDGKLDGGDSGQRTGTYWFAMKIYLETNISLPNCMKGAPFGAEEFQRALRAIQIKPGIWIRHPNSCDAWHSNPKQFSRDQQTALVLALGEWREVSPSFSIALKDTESAHRRRWGKYQNWDWATPEHMNFYDRAFDREKDYWLGDQFMILNSKILVEQSKKARDGDWVGNCLNHTLALIQAKRRWRTPQSEFAAQYFVENLRPSLMPGHPILSVWRQYFRQSWAPPMDEVMEPIITAYLLGGVSA